MERYYKKGEVVRDWKGRVGVIIQSDLARSDPNIGDDQIGLVWGVSK
jgi:hypothetical protein